LRIGKESFALKTLCSHFWLVDNGDIGTAQERARDEGKSEIFAFNLKATGGERGGRLSRSASLC
jgi:hypothetical protein